MKISGKRPVMFYQNGIHNGVGVIRGPRIRIFYPDGNVEWLSFVGGSGYEFDEIPCWAEDDSGEPYSFTDMFVAMDYARQHDMDHRFSEMEFLGEL